MHTQTHALTKPTFMYMVVYTPNEFDLHPKHFTL